jgi:C1A family cysteine protease
MRTFGLIRDFRDIRDYDLENEKVQVILDRLPKPELQSATAKVDWRKWCPPIVDQLDIGGCTANIGASLCGMFIKRFYNKTFIGSRMFLYYVTRRIMKLTGDTGATLRNTMQAISMIGLPPEEYWQYDKKLLDVEPPNHVFSLAENFKAITYYKLDGKTPKQTLINIKNSLLIGNPCMFGFSVFNSFPNVGDGQVDIPFPTKNDKLEGGHGSGLVGFDDNYSIGSRKGAFILRNSWGEQWGDKGYGWFPYDYVLAGLADDFWTITKENWVDVGMFA